MAGRVGTNQHTERVGNTLATHEKGKSADIAAAAVGMSGEQYRFCPHCPQAQPLGRLGFRLV